MARGRDLPSSIDLIRPERVMTDFSTYGGENTEGTSMVSPSCETSLTLSLIIVYLISSHRDIGAATPAKDIEGEFCHNRCDCTGRGG